MLLLNSASRSSKASDRRVSAAAGGDHGPGQQSADDSDDALLTLPPAYRGRHTTHAPLAAPRLRRPDGGAGREPERHAGGGDSARAAVWGRVAHGPAVQPDTAGGRGDGVDGEEGRSMVEAGVGDGGGSAGEGREWRVGDAARLRLGRVYGVQGTGLGCGGGTAQVKCSLLCGAGGACACDPAGQPGARGSRCRARRDSSRVSRGASCRARTSASTDLREIVVAGGGAADGA